MVHAVRFTIQEATKETTGTRNTKINKNENTNTRTKRHKFRTHTYVAQFLERVGLQQVAKNRSGSTVGPS